MKKLLISIFVFLCVCYGIDYSLRIKALGTDFAYLIPDYETDLTIDPNLLGNKLIGISYEPGQNLPFMMAALTKRFGWIGKYWFNYHNNIVGNFTDNDAVIIIEDLWLLDLRGKLPKFLADNVWNMSNDGRYDFTRHLRGSILFDKTHTLKYLIKTADAYKIGENMKLCIRGAYGLYLYDSTVHNAYSGHHNKWLGFFTPRIGLFYTKIHGPKRFTSFYIDIGGPISINDIDSLLYPILNGVPIDGYDIDLLFSIRNTIGKAAWVNGYPLSDKSFIAVGLIDEFMLQRLEIADTSLYFDKGNGLRNTLSLPLAFEIQVSRCAIRAGTKCYYNYNGDKKWDQDSTIIRINDHSLGFDYSFGMQVNLSDDGSVKLDLLNSGNISYISNWAIYLKKEW